MTDIGWLLILACSPGALTFTIKGIIEESTGGFGDRWIFSGSIFFVAVLVGIMLIAKAGGFKCMIF